MPEETQLSISRSVEDLDAKDSKIRRVEQILLEVSSVMDSLLSLMSDYEKQKNSYRTELMEKRNLYSCVECDDDGWIMRQFITVARGYMQLERSFNEQMSKYEVRYRVLKLRHARAVSEIEKDPALQGELNALLSQDRAA